MGKVFRPSNCESSILNKIESSREYARKAAINLVRENSESLGKSITMKLIEEHLVETINKNIMEKQLFKCLKQLCQADEFDINYQISPIRKIVDKPNIISLYITSFVVESLINHKSIVDIYGTDQDIYMCINQEVCNILNKL